MDVLTNVLETTQVRGAILSDARHSGHWGIRIDDPKSAGFHLVTEGEAWVRLARRKPFRLLQGDLLLVPNGAPHILSSAPDSPALPVAKLTGAPLQASTEVSRSVSGGTRMICGAFSSETGPDPLLALLPPVLHLEAAALQRDASLFGTVRLLVAELDRRGAGSATLIDRLLEVLFIFVVRAWADAQPEGEGGWLGALRDRHIGRALSLLHQRPHDDWTLERLALEVGQSRAAFARRFTALVGVAPLAYLTRWRMELALRALRTTDRTLAQIADDVGYASEFALSRAFKRELGRTPSSVRASVARGGESRPSAS